MERTRMALVPLQWTSGLFGKREPNWYLFLSLPFTLQGGLIPRDLRTAHRGSEKLAEEEIHRISSQAFDPNSNSDSWRLEHL